MKGISFSLLIFFNLACSSPRPKYHPINTPLESKQDEYRSCYLESESYKGRHSDERGVVKVSLTIDQNGKVINAKIAETAFKDPNFNACLLEQIRAITFAPPKDRQPIEVLYPLNFYPKTNE